MKQYLITGTDYRDPSALERRLKARPDHLAAMSALKKSGNFVTGGATLDAQGNMNGSVIILQFQSEADLARWKAEEPYLFQDVWETVDIKPFKVTNVE
jgi:uncharacterized protein YciI